MSIYANIIKQLQISSQSLADLLPLTQVSLPTLRKAVQELIENRWIRVVGQAEANGGRPAMLFGVDPSYYVLVGVHLQLPGIRLIASDLVGNILDQQIEFQRLQPTPEQVVHAIVDYTSALQRRLHEQKIIGISIAAPGFTMPDTGDIITIGRVAGWENFPISQRLQSQLNLPIQIANDVDCMAFAEFQYSGKLFSRNLAYFGFDEGVKVSMFLNGELYKGSFGNAGLIVNRFLNVPNEVLTLEEKKRILSISGLNQIFEEKVQLLPSHESALYADIINGTYRQRVEAIFAGAQTGMPLCIEIVDMLKTVFAAAVANIIYVIQPDYVVIGGIISVMPVSIFNELVATIRHHLPTLFANQVHVEQAQLMSSNIAALGANFHFIETTLLRESFELTFAR